MKFKWTKWREADKKLTGHIFSDTKPINDLAKEVKIISIKELRKDKSI